MNLSQPTYMFIQEGCILMQYVQAKVEIEIYLFVAH